MPRIRKDVAPNKKIGRDKAAYWLADKADWGGFINVAVNDQAKKEFQVWDEQNTARVWAEMQDILAEAGKISFSWDAINQCFIATLTGALCRTDNKRYSTSSRAPRLDQALSLLVWKHIEIVGGFYDDYRPDGDDKPKFNFG